ncbi:hypothetical protein UVI_02053140 [Ustilaginoidea virens]|uniref:C6 transcription factor n=1 Tax=Ustilaginoidea virens TaxID=1159556 RepID=A0A1B5L836_USTVR|nr:hypothetical protein UVI_02053140 [Ustilaginoidea virens]
MALSGNAACSLTEVSFRLLEHYLLETASMLATGTPAFNPFLTCVIPRAYCDSTLMHSILATSAAHLSYKLGDGGNPVIVEAAMQLALEVYLYLTLSNSILPPLVFDPATMYSDEMMRLYRTLDQYTYTPGTIFAGCRSLFELIPEAKALHTWRSAEQAAGVVDPSPEFIEALEHLTLQINAWHLDQQGYTGNAKLLNRYLDKVQQTQQSMAAECMRHALHIYTMSSVAGSAAASAALRESTQYHVDVIFWLSWQLEDSPASSNTLWATVIMGTCLEDEERRTVLAEGLRNSRLKMRHLSLVRMALEKLWSDEDERAWGPQGLEFVMMKNGMEMFIL